MSSSRGIRRQRRLRAGFTLLEVLVAATIMAIAVGTIFSTLSTSLRTAAKITERDQAAIQAQRILEDLLSDSSLPRGKQLQGHLAAAATGLEADWRAEVTTIDAAPSGWVVDRVAVQVLWASAGKPATLQLEGYRTARAIGQQAQPGGAR